MFNIRTHFTHNCVLAVFMSAVAITLMGAGYSIPEAGFDGTTSKMQQYGSTFAPDPGQYDRNLDGRIDLIIADRNGDGVPDYWATDRNYNGKFDDYQYDRNFDGKIDQWENDIDGDGISDKIYVDTSANGKIDLFAILNPVTRTYTWYGNMASNSQSPNSKNGKYKAPKSKNVANKIYRQAKGRTGDSE